MAKRHTSALRQHRRSLRAQERNRHNLARLRTGLKTLRKLIAERTGTESTELLVPTIALIDHSVSRRALHRNAASRLKSRLTRAVSTLKAS